MLTRTIGCTGIYCAATWLFLAALHMGPEHASREKKLSMVIFFIFVQMNIYIKGFQKMKIRPLKGFERMRFCVFTFRGRGVFWPKISLKLTSECLKYS